MVEGGPLALSVGLRQGYTYLQLSLFLAYAASPLPPPPGAVITGAWPEEVQGSRF